MPSTVAVARNAVSSSIVSAFRLLVHGCDEVLMIFDVNVQDIVVAIGPRGIEIDFSEARPLPDTVKSI